MARRRADAQEIGEIPQIADRRRRKRCLASLEMFCRTYGGREFRLDWADCQKRAVAKIQSAAEYGGWFAFGEPRGSGKTTRAVWSAIWAILKGASPYVVLIGATKPLARQLLRDIKTILMTNDLLLEDFPHAVWPFRMLGGEARKAAGQRFAGEQTAIEWSTNRIAFAWIPEKDSTASGAVIETAGITGAIRGMKQVLPDGSSIRPTFAIADDPQTRASARSRLACKNRLKTLTGDVAFLAGPDTPITVVCPCTVVEADDMADEILDPAKHPEWHGERVKMVEAFPTNVPLWDEYAEILRTAGDDGYSMKSATAFYRKNRKKMDAGAKVYWPARKLPTELSAIQHAMNLKIRDELAFWAECQNEPVQEENELDLIGPDALAKHIVGYDRGVIPDDCGTVTAFTDQQKDHLFWMVVAWAADYTGYVVDYGAWPEQASRFFTRRSIRRKLGQAYPGDSSAMIFGALSELGHKLGGPHLTPEGRPVYLTKEGKRIHLARWCIDNNWHEREAGTEAFARQSPLANAITLTKGRGVRASERPFSESERAKKWRTGPGWFWRDGPGPARTVIFDANLWKRRALDALMLPTGSRGALHFFKATPQFHQLLFEHLASERPIKTEARGRTVHEFHEIPNVENDGWDALVGNFLAASIAGVRRVAEQITPPRKTRRNKVTYL